MTFSGKPYFMENPDWYSYNPSLNKYVLTGNAPSEAVRDYNDFYSSLDSGAGEPAIEGQEADIKKSLGVI